MALKDRQITMQGVKLLWPNFSGREGQYNRAGERNFNVLIPEDLYQRLLADGWTVKRTKTKEVDGELTGDEPYLPVKINFASANPPKIVMITNGKRTYLTEDVVELLDYADISNLDLMVNPYNYNVSGSTGTNAYLHKLFATVELDELEKKYEDVPPAGGSHVDEAPPAWEE